MQYSNSDINKKKAQMLHGSIALGSLDAMQKLEKPKSARWNRLDGAIDAVTRYLDLLKYEVDFQGEDIDNASKLIDMNNDEIGGFYPHD